MITLLTHSTLLLATLNATPAVELQLAEGPVQVRPNELLIRPAANLSGRELDALAAELDLSQLRNIGARPWFRVQADAATADKLQALKRRVALDQRIVDVSYNAIVASDGGALKAAPRNADPHRELQWNLDLIDAEAAHEAGGLGSDQVIVAILDSGVAWRDAADGSTRCHPDLRHTLFVAPYDFVDKDAYPDDLFFHGTHVAGIIAAGANNGEGMLGLAPQTAIMPVRVLDETGTGSLETLVAGIDHAVANGADIINLSLSFTPGYRPGALLAEAIEDAWQAGVLIVASTGNYGLRALPYPAAYNQVLAVGAVGPQARIAQYGNYGCGIDLVAPGGQRHQPESGVLSAAIIDGDPTRVGYGWAAGTSQAAPHVAATAALLLAQGPQSPLELRNRIEQTATDLGIADWDARFGSGLLDPAMAIAHEVPVLSLDALPGWNERPALTAEELLLALVERVVLHAIVSEMRVSGGLLGDLWGNGAILDFLENNGGLLGELWGNGAILDFIENNGGLLGEIWGNAGLLRELWGNGAILDFLENNGGLLGELWGNSGLLRELWGNGAILDFIENNGALLGEIWGNSGLLRELWGNGAILDFLEGNGGLLGEIWGNGGILDFLEGNGGLLALLEGNGGILGLLEDNGGIMEFLKGNGGLLGNLEGNGGLLGNLEGNGGLLGFLRGNGGLLGFLEGNGGLLGQLLGNGALLSDLAGNGGLLGLLEGNGSELQPL